MQEHLIDVGDGRQACILDLGREGDVPVLFCHGGPGSRLSARPYLEEANELGLRLIGIDRPGYGKSSRNPGRRIGDWVADAIKVADFLELDELCTLGVSTGGAYALAVAAMEPDRVRGVVVTCGMTDMRWGAEHAPMPGAAMVWDAEGEEAASQVIINQFGAHGEKVGEGDPSLFFTESDIAYMADPKIADLASPDEQFTQGVVGYLDDRLADSPQQGWSSFDVSLVSCPVMVIHGKADKIVPDSHARHTASLIASATLKIFPNHGHMSIATEMLQAMQSTVLSVQ